jgi:hypothetical protein
LPEVSGLAQAQEVPLSQNEMIEQRNTQELSPSQQLPGEL